ncbi:hypothetical protein [Klebsiella pneumoniae]|uniref:hypothetical protein n=1 Tax=Klebsiella pneumoniae TaxID=573 RepID=UPI0022B72534|nr:hypothetical protein [Klebsiella pneumoniae]
MLAIRLSDEIRVPPGLAMATAEQKTFYAREATLAHQRPEDYYLQQKLLHAFAVVMKQCICLKT